MVSMGERVTADNLAPLVKVINFILLAFICLAVGCRMLVKLHILRTISTDDWLLLTAWVFSIAQSVAITIATIHGFGTRQSLLSPSQLVSIQKSLYASQLLYLPALAFAKLSVAWYLWKLSPVAWHRHMALTTGGVIIIWAASGELVWAFQCAVPDVWNFLDGEKCINLASFAQYMAAMNIITELALFLIPAGIILALQMRWRRQLTSITIFSSRFLVIAGAAAQLAFSSELGPDPDPTFSSWPYVIVTQVTQAACLIATCSLYTRSYLDAIQSGMIRVDDVRRRGEDPATYNADAPFRGPSLKMGSLQSTTHSKRKGSTSTSENQLLGDARTQSPT